MMSLFNLLLVMSPSFAADLKFEKPVAQFVECVTEYQKLKNLEVSRKCIESLVLISLPQEDRDRISSFGLLKPTDLRSRACNESDLQKEKFFSERTDHKVCIQFKLRKEAKSGILFFDREGADFKIKSLFY